MSYLPKTRMFNGERYRLHDEYLKRDTAEWSMGKLKSKKWKVRMVRILGLYGVYKRR